jgi:hypothetical protein
MTDRRCGRREILPVTRIGNIEMGRLVCGSNLISMNMHARDLSYVIIRKYDVPAGIAAHRIEPIKFRENEGPKPDFYMKTLHHERYWSAHPKAKRRFLEMYQPNSPNHDEYHDNTF